MSYYKNKYVEAFGEGDDKEKTTVVAAPNRYAPFGELAETFKGQGWTPEAWNNEYVEYRPGYGLLRSIDLGQGNKGYFSIRGGNNGIFNLFIKDQNGKIVGNPLLTNVSAKQINDYFTNYNAQNNYGGKLGSVVNQRANSIQAGTNTDLNNTMAVRK